MKYLLFFPMLLGILSCETYKDPSIQELHNTNIISSSKWSVQKANFQTNFDTKTREVSHDLDNGPGEVVLDFTINAGIDGLINCETRHRLDPSYVNRYFLMEEEFFFENGVHEDTWEWRVFDTQLKDSLDYSRAYLKIGNIRLKAKVYDHDNNRIYCYYDKSTNTSGETYKYHVNFWLIRE